MPHVRPRKKGSACQSRPLAHTRRLCEPCSHRSSRRARRAHEWLSRSAETLAPTLLSPSLFARPCPNRFTFKLAPTSRSALSNTVGVTDEQHPEPAAMATSPDRSSANLSVSMSPTATSARDDDESMAIRSPPLGASPRAEDDLLASAAAIAAMNGP